jgi:predicted SnoaL-like aldol condensation-catalyzing enzyme
MTHAHDVESDKEAAVQFLQLVVAGHINEAYGQFVDMRGTHHNPHFRAGFSELRQAMIEDHVRFPTKQLLVKHVLGDGDMVAVHSHLIVTAAETGMVVWHLFRFRDTKIVEMWDCGQPVPADSPNEDGTF